MCKFADAFSPCEGIETLEKINRGIVRCDAFSPCEGIETLYTDDRNTVLSMHLARARALKLYNLIFPYHSNCDAFSPCEGIETDMATSWCFLPLLMHIARARALPRISIIVYIDEVGP